jgi:Oxidoreductase-like protein, N-terminal
MESRLFSGTFAPLRCLHRAGRLSSTTRISSNVRYATTRHPEQANPLGDYYESLLSQPLPSIASATRQPTKPSPQTSLPKTDKEETLAKARVVFGSRLGGPAERRSEIEKKSTLVAGVWVPPRPEEPDNCCMSGCVNCVWDRYGEEMEDWARARKAADANLRKEKGLEKGRSRRKKSSTGLMLGEGEKGAQHTMVSMDDDGGGSETNWTTGLDSDLFSGIPVGILEFMKQEKRLKEKHARDGTTG